MPRGGAWRVGGGFPSAKALSWGLTQRQKLRQSHTPYVVELRPFPGELALDQAVLPTAVQPYPAQTCTWGNRTASSPPPAFFPLPLH